MSKRFLYGGGVLSAEAKQVLMGADLFKGLTRADINLIEHLCEEQSYNIGSTIFEDGIRAYNLYILASGRMVLLQKIRGEKGEEQIAVKFLSPGDSFGWPALIEPYLYVLSAICMGDVKVIAIDAMRLRYLMESQESIGFHVLRRLVTLLYQRLQETRSAILSRV